VLNCQVKIGQTDPLIQVLRRSWCPEACAFTGKNSVEGDLAKRQPSQRYAMCRNVVFTSSLA
jgi:hypothetical protein